MATTVLNEADLHGIVDGYLECDRRADLLRRLAASPKDRARVEAWQEQNDLIRAAFSGIEHETLPVSLDLVPPPNLGPFGAQEPLSDDILQPARFGGSASGLAAVLLVVAGLGICWMIMDGGGKDPAIAGSALRGTMDATLVARATGALATDAHTRRPVLTKGGDRLPTTMIPDLSPSGFSLTGAEAEVAEPASLVFHYQNRDADRVVISVARSQGATAAPPTKIGGSYSWHRGDKAYAIAGTVQPERLHDIAMSLQDDAGDH